MSLARSEPFFTIGMPTFNRPETTRLALESCLSQDYPHFEVIVSDSTAGDAIKDIATSFGSPKIKYIRHDPPLELIPKANDLVQRATGQWMVFLCDDDTFSTTFLSRAFEVISRDPRAALIHTRSRLIDSDGKYISEDRVQKPIMDPIDLMPVLFRPWYDMRMNLTGYLFPVHGMKAVGGIPSFYFGYFSDNIAWAKVGTLGNSYFLPESLVSLREWSQSFGRSSSLNHELIIAGREQVVASIDTIFMDLSHRFPGPHDQQRIAAARKSCVDFVLADADDFMHRILVATLLQNVPSTRAQIWSILTAIEKSDLAMLKGALNRALVRMYGRVSDWPVGVRRPAAWVLKKCYGAARIIRNGGRTPHG